ncbi:MAG: hypothetical protein EA371_00100 [Gammaproteobacteria bacterium]|nr:MAG: hypothetical protein EA371_00100 [Gammaproteobacteria bacterium]
MNAASIPPDRAVRGILLANGMTLLMALWQGWSVLQLMWPFWVQSLIIGWYARQRMLKLTAFCTEGMKINNRPVKPTPASQRNIANFFALHYGGFHLVYLVFLVALTTTTDAAGFITVTNESTGAESLVYIGHVHPLDFVIYLFLAAGFVGSHRASHQEHVQADLGGVPKLGQLMMLPYLRVIPMHLTMIIAFAFGGGALWLFVLLKVAADVAMHKVEHAVLQSGQDSPATTTRVGS